MGNEVLVVEAEQFYDSSDHNLGEIHLYKDITVLGHFLSGIRDVNVNYIVVLSSLLKKENIDLVQISHPSGALALWLVMKLLRKKVPIVYDAQNVDSEYMRETMARDPRYSALTRAIHILYSGVLERIVCRYIVGHITAVSARDKEMFLKLYGIQPAKVDVIPSGGKEFDTPSLEGKLEARMRLGIEPHQVVILFHGYYHHLPNKEAYEIIRDFIAPRVGASNKEAIFVVGGTGFERFAHGNLKSLGFIEDLYAVLSASDMAIVPLLHGAGTKIKVFDYMSIGLAIVSTKKGMEGIEARNGRHAIILDNVDEEFTNAVQYLVENPLERFRLGQNVKELFKEEYDWNKIGVKLNTIQRYLVGKSKVTNRKQS